MYYLLLTNFFRVLASLGSFLDKLDLTTVAQNATNNKTTFTFNTFAIQVQEIDPRTFNGQTFIVDLGSFEQVSTVSNVDIDVDALITINNDVLAEERSEEDLTHLTTSLELKPSLFEGSRSSNSSSTTIQRVSYTVFLKDSLFLPENVSLNKVGSVIVAVRTSHQYNESILGMPVRVNFSVNEMVSLMKGSLY